MVLKNSARRSSLSGHKWFNDEKERRKWQNPEAILADIGLRLGFTFMDIGCGDGFFAIPAARLVGERGRVYALDVDSEAVDRLRRRAKKEGLINLSLKVGPAEETVLCEACADMVFFGINLHDFRDPSKVLMNAKRMLKPTGRLIDLDWKKQPMEIGPPLGIRFSDRKTTNLIKAAGFMIEAVKEAGPYHYLIIAKQ